MNNEPKDHEPAHTAAEPLDEAGVEGGDRRHRGPLKKVVDTLVGDPGGHKTGPGPIRGWEQPLEEQQAEPENEPIARDAD